MYSKKQKHIKNRILAGFAQTDITPIDYKSCELVGFFWEDNFARGILHPLQAQVLIFKNADTFSC